MCTSAAALRAAASTASASPPASRAAMAAFTTSPVPCVTDLLSMTRTGTGDSAAASVADSKVPDSAADSVIVTMSVHPLSASCR